MADEVRRSLVLRHERGIVGSPANSSEWADVGIVRHNSYESPLTVLAKRGELTADRYLWIELPDEPDRWGRCLTTVGVEDVSARTVFDIEPGRELLPSDLHELDADGPPVTRELDAAKVEEFLARQGEADRARAELEASDPGGITREMPAVRREDDETV